jgi:hypothetical protein
MNDVIWPPAAATGTRRQAGPPVSAIPGSGATLPVFTFGRSAEELEARAREKAAPYFGCDPDLLTVDPYATDQPASPPGAIYSASVTVHRPSRP